MRLQLNLSKNIGPAYSRAYLKLKTRTVMKTELKKLEQTT
jgi:hypothetical protein